MGDLGPCFGIKRFVIREFVIWEFVIRKFVRRLRNCDPKLSWQEKK